MRKKVLILGLCLLGVTHSLSSKDKKSIPLYKDAKAPIEKRIDDLISRMTLEEKVLQLNQYTLGRNNNVNNVGEEVKKVPSEIGSLIYFDINPELRNSMQKKAMEESRLGIPIIFGYDAIHGFRTIYPISLGQACSWNPGLVEQACAVSAQEARMSGVDWTFSPMIDVARDPRWGRVAEGYGEDPYTKWPHQLSHPSHRAVDKYPKEFELKFRYKHNLAHPPKHHNLHSVSDKQPYGSLLTYHLPDTHAPKQRQTLHLYKDLHHISYFVGAGLFMESGIGRTGMCGICTRSPHVWG